MTLHNNSNIVLIGFMGTGKTRVGEQLAQTLGFDLVDLDATIEIKQKKTIKEIFDLFGELHFRNLELEVLQQLLDCKNCIIVTGGGTPTYFASNQVLKKLGEIFCLDANFSLILSRIKNSKKRPLAAISSPESIEDLKELYSFRRPIYQNLGSNIDVNHQDKTKTCQEIINIWQAKKNLFNTPKINIQKTIGSYNIYLKNNVISQIKTYIKALGLDHCQVALITNNNIQEILKIKLELIKQILSPNLHIITIEDGERYKTIESINYIHQELLRLGFNRQSLILAFGGGNVGDVAGFAAATFMRGVNLIQIPTTLLAMVDSSIGGKTAVDTAYGKNLVGAFYNPCSVLIDPDFLTTLPAHEYSCGMAEIIKHAIIADKDLFHSLLKQNIGEQELISRAIRVKADIVFADPDEKNLRMHLNLGHTFAHAIENISNYKINHGFAVAIGLVLATKLAKFLGILEEDFLGDLKTLLDKFSLPTEIPKDLDIQGIIKAMKRDKKLDAFGLRFILPKRLGEVNIHYVNETELITCLN